MNLEQIVKETVAKIVAEKQGKDLTGDGKIDSADYLKARSNAIEKAKGLDEDSINDFGDVAGYIIDLVVDEGIITPEEAESDEVINNALEISEKMFGGYGASGQGISTSDYNRAARALVASLGKSLNEDHEDHEVSMAQSSLNSILRSAMELKAKIGGNEIDIPAWIQDHITNSENFIDQASQGYHEYSNGGHEGEEMNEARVSQDNVVNYLANALQSVWNAGKGNNSIDFQDFAQSLYFDMFGGDEMNEGYNSEQSAIESASGDKITGTEEDDYGNTLYIGQDPYDQYFIVNGEIKHDNFQKGIKSVTIGMLKHYGDGQNHSADDDMYEAFKPKSSFDDYKIGDNVTVAGKKAKITNMKMDDESGERRARVRFEDGTAEEVSINTLDENTMTTNEGRSAEDIKQAQLDQAYSHLEKIKEKPKLFSSEDIKKAEARIEKLEAELDALAAKATNESLDEATVRRWQHYAGIK
jgi:hypothetical protein